MPDIWDSTVYGNSEFPPVYSNGDRTASATTITEFTRNIQSKITGKWYVELTVAFDQNPDDQYRVGIVGSNSAVSFTFPLIFIGEDTNSIGWTSKGNVVLGGYIGNAEPYASGDIVCIACDFDENKVWFRTNNQVWTDQNNTPNSVSDPYKVLGGADISTMALESKYVGVMLSANSSVTISALQYVPPVGFIPWINPILPVGSSGTVLPLPLVDGIIANNLYTAYGNNSLGLFSFSTAYSFDPYDVTFPYDQYGAQARVNIFDIPKVVHLVLPDSYVGAPVLMNYPINRTDFKLVRGVPNVIQFFVRDVDRHIATIPLANATLTINIVDTWAGQILLQRDLFTVNSTTALYGLSTQPVDMLNWPTGPLQYSVQITRGDGTQGLLWTDRDYTPFGFCIVMDGPLPTPASPTILDPTTFVIQDGYAYSSALPGTAQLGYPDGMQTFSFYTENFTGNVAIQGSLVTQPSTAYQDWFNISYQNFLMANGVTGVNIEGNYLWLRVALPTTETLPYPTPLGPIPQPIGNVTQILYLN